MKISINRSSFPIRTRAKQVRVSLGNRCNLVVRSDRPHQDCVGGLFVKNYGIQRIVWIDKHSIPADKTVFPCTSHAENCMYRFRWRA